MKKKTTAKPTASKFSLLRQICSFIPPHLVPHLARETDVDEKARTFSPWSHVVSLLYGSRPVGNVKEIVRRTTTAQSGHRPVDCLQMADKGAVFLKNADLFKILEAASHHKARKFFERVVNVAEPPKRIDPVVEINPRQAGSRRDSDGVPSRGIRACGRTFHWSRSPRRRNGPRKDR
jgi:hypothetical protein